MQNKSHYKHWYAIIRKGHNTNGQKSFSTEISRFTSEIFFKGNRPLFNRGKVSEICEISANRLIPTVFPCDNNLVACIYQASAYAECVIVKDSLNKGDCQEAFNNLNKCFKVAVSC